MVLLKVTGIPKISTGVHLVRVTVTYFDVKRKSDWDWGEPSSYNQVNCSCSPSAGLLKASHSFTSLTVSIRNLKALSRLLLTLLDCPTASMMQKSPAKRPVGTSTVVMGAAGRWPVAHSAWAMHAHG